MRFRTKESQLQAGCVTYLRAAHPDVLFWHVENEGQRTPGQYRLWKALGGLAGVPDLEIMRQGKKNLYVEFKAGRNQQTKGQVEFMIAAVKAGHPYAVCSTVEGFVEFVEGEL